MRKGEFEKEGFGVKSDLLLITKSRTFHTLLRTLQLKY